MIDGEIEKKIVFTLIISLTVIIQNLAKELLLFLKVLGEKNWLHNLSGWWCCNMD